MATTTEGARARTTGGLRSRASALGRAVGRLGTPPGAATALTGIVALYVLLVAFGNITDFGTNREFVRHVLAMDTTFKDEQLMWRAISSPALQDAVYVCIIAWETLTAAVLCVATARWASATWRGPRTGTAPYAPGAAADTAHDAAAELAAHSARFERARRTSTLGLVLHLLLFGAGFIAVGGEWFAMWQSKDWNGLDAAVRNVTVAGLALILVQLPARRPTERSIPAPPQPAGEPD